MAHTSISALNSELPADAQREARPIRVTVWNEYVHEQRLDNVRAIYPDGIHATIAAALDRHLGTEVSLRTATMGEPHNGLPADVLDATDVLIWWGHIAHADVADDVVQQVQDHVLGGMGLIVLHSGHFSKIFRRLMGTKCSLMWRHEEGGERETVWTVAPEHPIADNVPHPIVLNAQEMYGEYFDIPTPDELVFVSSFAGGEVFRSGCCFIRGKGRIFYFSPGDQKYPVYHNEDIQQVLANATKWATNLRLANHNPPGIQRVSANWFEQTPLLASPTKGESPS